MNVCYPQVSKSYNIRRVPCFMLLGSLFNDLCIHWAYRSRFSDTNLVIESQTGRPPSTEGWSYMLNKTVKSLCGIPIVYWIQKVVKTTGKKTEKCIHLLQSKVPVKKNLESLRILHSETLSRPSLGRMLDPYLGWVLLPDSHYYPYVKTC